MQIEMRTVDKVENRDPISSLVHTVVRIECFDAAGKTSSGSGYFYVFCEEETRNILCIVTNKHVMLGAVRVLIRLTLSKSDGSPDIGNYDTVALDLSKNLLVHHPNPAIDLVAISMGPTLRAAELCGKKYHLLSLAAETTANEKLLASLSPMEDIIMLGYPIGIWDAKHNMPVIRRGITATHARLPLNGKPEFLIDAACFPGSSGSPVFLANMGTYSMPDGGTALGTRISLLGTLYAGPLQQTEGEVIVVNVPTSAKSVSRGTAMINLGYVIQAKELLVLEAAIREAANAESKTRAPSKPSRNSKCPCASGKRYKACCGVQV